MFNLFTPQKTKKQVKPNCTYTYYSIAENFVPDFMRNVLELAFRYDHGVSRYEEIKLEWLIVVKRETGNKVSCCLCTRDAHGGKLREKSLDIEMGDNEIATLKSMGILTFVKRVNFYNDHCSINLLVDGKRLHVTYYREIPEHCSNVHDTIVVAEWWLLDTGTMARVKAELNNIFSR